MGGGGGGRAETCVHELWQCLGRGRAGRERVLPLVRRGRDRGKPNRQDCERPPPRCSYCCRPRRLPCSGPDRFCALGWGGGGEILCMQCRPACQQRAYACLVSKPAGVQLNSCEPIKKKVESMEQVTAGSMLGYQCFLIKRKFFVGFGSKNNRQIIVRIPQDQQETAIKPRAFKPFFHGAKMGWIEIDSKLTTTAGAMKWILMGHGTAAKLANSA